MKIEVITSEKQYEIYLERMKVIFNAKDNTPENTELNKLADALEAYENKHYNFL